MSKKIIKTNPLKEIKTKNVFAIFAHPDDEAFGPAGTLHTLAKNNHSVHILCATRGEAGQNHHDQTHALNEKRSHELQNSAKIIGVESISFLGFSDGTLANNLYHQIASKVQEEIYQKIKDQEFTIITFDKNGVSGHLDHIAMSYISTYIYHHNQYCKSIWYYTKRKIKSTRLPTDYFVYYPEGTLDDEIDLLFDIQNLANMKKMAINAHLSQVEDMKKLFVTNQYILTEEAFLIENKTK